MKTEALTAEAERYLSEVATHLGDLPDSDRADLLEDVRQNLEEAREEAGSIRSRLGEPGAYANEIRVAAGFAPRTEPEATHAGRRLALLEASAAVRNHRWVRGFTDYLRASGPGWWVVRGFIVAYLPIVNGTELDDHTPFPQPFVVGVAWVGACVAASVALGVYGRRSERGLIRRLSGAATLAVALLAFVAVASFDYVLMHRWALFALVERNVTSQSDTGPFVLRSQHGLVTNILPYDRDGRPLEGVLLFDQDGRPLRTDAQLWWADGCQRERKYPLAADGVPVEFSYPHKYERAAGDDPASGVCGQVGRPAVPIPTFSAQATSVPAPSAAAP